MTTCQLDKSSRNFLEDPTYKKKHTVNALMCAKLCVSFITRRVTTYIAEREGFEPPEACTSTVFKTAAIDHSAISPGILLKCECKGIIIFEKSNYSP